MNLVHNGAADSNLSPLAGRRWCSPHVPWTNFIGTRFGAGLADEPILVSDALDALGSAATFDGRHQEAARLASDRLALLDRIPRVAGRKHAVPWKSPHGTSPDC